MHIVATDFFSACYALQLMFLLQTVHPSHREHGNIGPTSSLRMTQISSIMCSYLVSFMRATDNFSEAEAQHKFNQMRRLLTSSGDNWVRLLTSINLIGLPAC